jgi:hypothetical protein
MSVLSKLRGLLGPGNKSEWYYKTRHSNEYFNRWAKAFNVAYSLDYFIGKQWRNSSYPINYSPYVVNLVYSTIKVKRPSLLFDRPIYHLLPKPSPDFDGFDFDAAAKRVALKQDVLNDWVGKKKNYFAFETKQAIVDAFFGFGIIEIGYSATWIDNPLAPRPAYDKIDDPEKITNKPIELPDNEQTFIKRIPFPQFRVGGIDSPIIERNNWVGYWEFVDRRDLENASGYDYRADYSGNRSSEADAFELPFGSTGNLDNIKEYLKKGDLVKIWKIWDFRSKNYLVWAEDKDDLVFADEFEESPFSRLAFDDNLYGFYPIPPVSQWLSSQDEVNESSEQLRVHRRRSNRKYMVSAEVDDLELQKLLNGPDGTYGKFEGDLERIIAEVPQGAMDQANSQAFVQSKDNFNIVSQTSSELRGQVDRQTATAATITQQQSQITDSEPKTIVSDWLVDIGENVLDKLSISVIPFWVRRESQQPQLGQSSSQAVQFYKVSGQDLQGDDYEVNVMISSLSPIDNAVELQNFQTFMGLLNQNPEFSLSPVIIREIAARCNYTNEAVIEDLQKMATLKLMGLQQNAAGPGQPQNNQQPTNPAVNNQGPPQIGAIPTQLNGQQGLNVQ